VDENRVQAEPEAVTSGDTPGPPGMSGSRVAEQPETTDAAAELADVEDQLRRTLADLDNMRKRYGRELARERASERSRLLGEWLPIVDNFERALEHRGADVATLLQGLQAVRDQAVSVLERLGFPRFEDVGQPFNPARHEAVSTVDDDTPAGTVVGVVRPGYGTNEEILRPAGVVVSRGSGNRNN
jgi:molecular chaperone GrpE